MRFNFHRAAPRGEARAAVQPAQRAQPAAALCSALSAVSGGRRRRRGRDVEGEERRDHADDDLALLEPSLLLFLSSSDI